MAQGPTYRVKFRRRREGKTNYYRRRRLLLSRQARLVVRKTNNQLLAQFINAKVIGDMTAASAISKELTEYGWAASISNMPAAYLTGLLAGLRAKSRGIDSAILDIGLIPPIRGSKIYAVLKGVLDAGVNIPHNPEVLPAEDRITGQHVVSAYEHFTVGDNPANMFTKVGKKKTTITGLPKKVDAVKKTLLAIPKADLKKKKKKAPTTAKKAPKKAAKPKKEKPTEKPPRAVPRKPKPKKLIARGKGKKGRRGKGAKGD